MNLPKEKITREPLEVSTNSSTQVSNFYRAIPNILTFLRLLGTPIILWAILQYKFSFALLLFFTISITDWFDGYLARRWNANSKLGQILDPLADKFLLISVYLLLGIREFIPLWLTILVLGRDLLILIIGSGILLRQKGHISLPPQFIGKASTLFQMLFIGSVFLCNVPVPAIPTSSIQSILMVFLLYVVAVTTILSGITYAKVAFNVLHKS